MTKDQLIKEAAAYIEAGSEEEREAFAFLLQGLQKKQNDQSGSYIGAWLQPERTYLPEGKSQITIPLRVVHENPHGIAHGGITATLIDMATGDIVHRSLPEGKKAVTADMHVHYLQPGRGETLTATAEMIRTGKTLCTARAEIYDERGVKVAEGTAMYAVLP
ncbi:uncharacterized protein (TIGR00369 family) [Salsuginibacillus halophilus]|uniref:Uncharacterized protein (TIGR00369 family) n=1 Tax=Salsuginibacillus halophilus TaxID=517424 RepID=A0A2P8HX82_9BACI|nr:PaaI family thioesterase [Salsuginibacillus halophilus]PSL50817.1 uncharacterized protein (TIGR00369 family) [Salsuginibacillus halophilus]